LTSERALVRRRKFFIKIVFYISILIFIDIYGVELNLSTYDLEKEHQRLLFPEGGACPQVVHTVKSTVSHLVIRPVFLFLGCLE
jgi:hypothetical protein